MNLVFLSYDVTHNVNFTNFTKIICISIPIDIIFSLSFFMKFHFLAFFRNIIKKILSSR